MKIEYLKLGDSNVTEKVLRTLTDWFAIKEANLEFAHRSSLYPQFVAIVENKPIGFLSLKIHNPHSAEIYVMGVIPCFHRQSVGTKLLDAAEAYLEQNGFRYLQVKTLSEDRECQYYRSTRLFYFASGFSPLEVFPILWDESNPCLLMVKALRSKSSATHASPKALLRN